MTEVSLQDEMRAKTLTFKHAKVIPFKNRREINTFLKEKFGCVYSPYLDTNKTALYYGIPDKKAKHGWRQVATYEPDVLRY